MKPDGLQTFIDDVGLVVSSTDDEHEITKRVAKRLSDLLAGSYRLPPEVTRPSPVRHVTYPLYIEHEVRYLKPVASTAGAALTPPVKSCGSPGR